MTTAKVTALAPLKAELNHHDYTYENKIIKIVPLFLASYPSKHTSSAYQKALQDFFDFWAENEVAFQELDHLQRFHIEGWQRAMEASRKLSMASISAKVSALVSLARFMFENDWVKKNAGEFIKLPRISKQKGKTQALSEDEIKMLIGHLHEEQQKAVRPSAKKDDYRAWVYYGIFLTLATVGMRCSELARLTLKDFKKAGEYYRLHLSLKGGEEHSPLIPAYLSDYLCLFIKNCRSFAKDTDPIFTLAPNSHQQIKREYLSKIITSIAKKYGVDRKISAHSLRATVASLLHKSNIPVGEIKELLGHKSIMTTMMYVRKTDEEKESAALKSPLGNILNIVHK